MNFAALSVHHDGDRIPADGKVDMKFAVTHIASMLGQMKRLLTEHIPIIFIQLSDPVNDSLMPLMISVRHIEACNVHAPSSQGCKHFC